MSGLPLNKIYNMDCLEGLKQLEDNSVDLIVTDPPYPIPTNNGTNRFAEDGWFEGTQEDYSEEWYEWFEDICLHLNRILKEGKHFYCYVDEKNLFLLKPILDKHFVFKKVIVWHKKDIGLGYHYRNVLEYVFLYSKGKSEIHINNKPNFFMCSKDIIEGHPTVKPISMIKWLISNSTTKDDLVLDIFMGSGTSAVACKQLNRNYIGYELSEKYCEIANKRLSQSNLLEVLENT